jgi:phosphoserine aminotransferase
LQALIARADANAAALDRWVQSASWIEHLAADPAIRSNTSVCLQFADRSDDEANRARQKAIGKLLEQEGAAYDVTAYRDAPPGLRIWCGATVETADIETLGPWLGWAWEATAP